MNKRKTLKIALLQELTFTFLIPFFLVLTEYYGVPDETDAEAVAFYNSILEKF